MLNIKNMPCRRIIAFLCAFLLFAMLLAPVVHADSAVITSGTMYSYFQTYNTSGTWVDLQTPAHWITSTGEVAYCLQTSKDNPYNSAYTSIDGGLVYDDYVLAGLRAILTHGYPADDGGFSAQEARYATANAIRFWLAECHCDGVPQYLNLTVNGDWIRGRPGCEDLFDWSLGLLNLARSQTIAISDGSLVFNPPEITLTQNGQYFTGTVFLNKNISGEYSLMDDMPDGKIITGHTGVQSENLTIQIPTSYPNSSYTLCAYGFNETPAARLFFWAPSAANQQRIVTYVLDDMEKTFVRGFLKVNTPSASVQPQKGSLRISKTDDGGNPLSGVGFTLYDSYGQALTTQRTDSSGVVTFSDLTLGDYYYAETSALPGYVPDSTRYPVSISSNGQIVQKTMTNSLAQGSLKVIKTDTDGNPLMGVSFNLLDSSGGVVGNGVTDSNGEMFFPLLSLGDYYLQETATLPGFILDSAKHKVTVSSNGQVAQITLTNERSPSKGSLKIVKTDESGTPIASTGFQLLDSAGNRIASGGTDSNGLLVFSDLPLGNYFYQETFAVPGFALDDTKYPISITENGQVITKTIVNYKSAGTIKILKTDSETGQPLKGAEFTILDDHMREVAKGTTDESGVVVFAGLPLGPYYCQESQVPPGYFPEGGIELVYLDGNGKVVTLSYTNKPARGSIKITKRNNDGELLSGVVFTLYDADKHEIKTGTTDANGVVIFDGLPIGDYWYAETSELPGYIPNHNLMAARVGYHTAVDEHTFTNFAAHGHVQIIKTDDTGAKLAGVHFQLTDISGTLIAEGDTGSDGKLIFSMVPVGSYLLKETSVPEGYVLDSTPIPISLTSDGEVVSKDIVNPRSVGGISVTKTDKDTGAPLSGVHFKLTDRSGRLIQEGDTDSRGLLSFTGIPLGDYLLQETSTLNGYVLDETPISVSLTQSGQTVSKSITNSRATGSLSVTKTDKDTGAFLGGVHFKLTTASGTLIREGDTDASGQLSFTDIPIGDYLLQEASTLNGYVLDETPISVSLTQSGQTVSKSITNSRAAGSVSVTKTDKNTGAPLSGVHFKLTDRSGVLVQEGDTDVNGKLSFTAIPLGEYLLQETSALSGYVLNETPISVSLTQNGQVVELSVQNDPVIGSLKIIKKIANEDLPLAQAGFRLFKNDGTLLKEGFTDTNGELVFSDIPYGTDYYYQEFSVPKGYVLDDTKHPLSITETESALTKTIENSRREGTLHILKQDQRGRPLQGAAYYLEISTDNGSSWAPAVSRPAGNAVTAAGCTSPGLNAGCLTTGADGLAVFTGLRADDHTLFRVTEVEAPAGYSLMAEPLFVGTLPIAVTSPTIDDSETVDGSIFTYTLYITATDSVTYRLPETGGTGFPLTPIGLLFLAVPFFIPKFKKFKETAYENT